MTWLDPSSLCLIGLLVLIVIVILGRIILKIALWIIIIILAILIIGGGITYILKLFGMSIYPIIESFLV